MQRSVNFGPKQAAQNALVERYLNSKQRTIGVSI